MESEGISPEKFYFADENRARIIGHPINPE
jgi:hypothetical protein